MASDVSTIQSLKAVDAWIDVINANINGGVRTAFKSSRLKFSGSNVDVARAGHATSLPLQFPEAGLTTANTVIDFTQGAITASTETTHLAIQGDGFFLMIDPGSVNADGSLAAPTASTRLYLTRDGEFRTNQNGLLVNHAGYVLINAQFNSFAGQTLRYSTAFNGAASGMRAVYNNIDSTAVATTATRALRLTDYVANGQLTTTTVLADGVSTLGWNASSMFAVTRGKQDLQYTALGSTIFDFNFQFATGTFSPDVFLNYATAAWGSNTETATILTKSLEASNASMTQSVPELSLAQKLFSALTKVLQTKQTNVDGVLNLVR